MDSIIIIIINSSMYLLFNFFVIYLFTANFTPMSAAQPVLQYICMVSEYKSERMWQDVMTD